MKTIFKGGESGLKKAIRKLYIFLFNSLSLSHFEYRWLNRGTVKCCLKINNIYFSAYLSL